MILLAYGAEGTLQAAEPGHRSKGCIDLVNGAQAIGGDASLAKHQSTPLHLRDAAGGETPPHGHSAGVWEDLDRPPGGERTAAIERVAGVRHGPEGFEAGLHPAVELVVSRVGGAGVDVNAQRLQLTLQQA